MAKQKRQLARKIAWAVATGVGTVLVLSGATFAYFHFTYANKIGPHVEIASHSVAGLTPVAAKNVVQTAINSVAATSVKLQGQNIDESITPDKLGVTYDVDATVAAAYAVGRENNPVLTVLDQIQILIGKPINKQAVVIFERKPIDDTVTTINSKLGDAAVDAGLKLTSGKLQAVSEHAGMAVDSDTVVASVLDRLQTISTDRTIQVALTQREPTVRQSDVVALIPTLQPLVSTAITLTIPGGNPIKVDATTLASWIGFIRTADSSTAKYVLATTPASDGTKASVQAIVNQKALGDYLAGIAKQTDQAAVDAQVNIVDGKVSVFQASQAGRSLNQANALTTIADAITAQMQSAASASTQVANSSTTTTKAVTKFDPISIALSTDATQPAVTNDTISTLGINELIGTGTTDFSGSSSNRVANIKTGANSINGQLIAPGAEFSTLGALGPVDSAHGYVQGLVILNNKTVPADGGGLCQVSTTLFRSVLNAGLPITARSPHSYEVSYYQRGIGPGLDATIFEPKPDFKWTNDTGHYVFIQGIIKGNSLTFNLYGTSDGRKATVDGPHTLSTTQPDGTPVYVESDSLPDGKVELIDPPVPGAKTTATYTVTRDGKVINQQVFNSSYTAMPAQYLVGPNTDASQNPSAN